MTVSQMELGLNEKIRDDDVVYTSLTPKERTFVKQHKVVRCRGQ